MNNEDTMFDTQLDEKRTRLQSILRQHEEDNIAKEKQALEASAMNNQKQRIDIARKLNEYNKNKGKREETWKKLEEDLLEYKKRDMIESILGKKRYQMDTKEQISKLESEQVQLLAKLDLIRQEAFSRQADIEASKVEWERKFEPVMASNLVPDAAKTVHGALSKYDRNINDAVTRELQRSLYELFIETSQRLVKEREALKAERNHLEELLQQNLQRLHFDSTVGVDYDIDTTLEIAKNMQSIVEEKMVELQERMNEIREEEMWLLSEPNSASWKRITERIAETNRNRERLQQSSADSKHFLSFKKSKQEARTTEAMTELKNSMANVIFAALLDEVTELMVDEVARDMVTMRQMIFKRVTNICVETASGTTKDDMPALHSTGTAFLLQGCFADMTHSYRKYDRFHYRRTQPVVSAANPNPRKFRMPKQSLHRVISLRDSILQFDDAMLRWKLEKYELHCWRKVVLTSCGASPLIVPSELSRLRVLKIFPRALAEMSLIFCGAKNGRIAIWSVPWAGGSSAYVGLTPMLPLAEIADVENIVDNPIPGNQFLSIDSKGVVRMWVMNPVTTRKSHSGRMFPKSDAAFAPNIPSCIYYISLTEYNMTSAPSFMPSSLNNYGRQKKKKKRIDYLGLAKPQKGTRPTTLCFFPQSAITGRSPSIVVGTAGGRIFKLNADFKESTFETKLAYAPCIPKVEWMNPASLVKDNSGIPHSMVVAAQEPDKKGNKVYRELFHYHKDPIIFLGTLRNISNRLVSIDSTGKAALWVYDSDYFCGRCSFTPMSTATLDLRWLVMSIDPSVQPPVVTQPVPQVLRELKMMRRNKLPDGRIVISFQPHTVDNSQVLYECKFTPRGVHLNVDNDWREDIANALKLQWTANVVQTATVPTNVHGAHMTVDGEELVFMLSYDKLTLGLPKKVAKFTYNNREDSKNNDGPDARSKVAIIVCLSLNNLEVHRPVAVFEVAPQDYLLGISIGPVLGDTLSRMAFVQTDKQIRVFSLETGQELISDTFPFTPGKTLPKFRPLMSAFCPLQKMAVFASSDDARLSVQMFSSSGKSFSDIPSSALDGYHRSVDHLRNLVFRPLKSDSDEDPLPQNPKWLVKLIDSVIDECLDGVEEVIDIEYRKDIIYKLFGNSKLGIIEPTQWPVPFTKNDDECEESGASEDSSSDSSDDDSDDSDDFESTISCPTEITKAEVKSLPDESAEELESDEDSNSKSSDRNEPLGTETEVSAVYEIPRDKSVLQDTERIESGVPDDRSRESQDDKQKRPYSSQSRDSHGFTSSQTSSKDAKGEDVVSRGSGGAST